MLGDQAIASAAMRVTSRDRALAKIREVLELLQADPEEQASWAKAAGLPTDEIVLQYYDAVPSLLYGLRERGVIDEDAERAMMRLHDYLMRVQRDLFCDDPAVARTSEWDRVRDLATAALKTLG